MKQNRKCSTKHCGSCSFSLVFLVGSDVKKCAIASAGERMRLKMWVALLCFLISVKGVSFTNKCSETIHISVSPGESINLNITKDEAQENSLIDDSGKEIARIEKGGKLVITDKSYKHKLNAKGFSFYINATTEGQWNFTASVLYANDTHCTVHYIVHVDRICSENKAISHTLPDHHFTLDFDPDGVMEIIWVDSSGINIAITKDKAQLQILESEYEGSLSVIGVSLRKHDVTTEDHGAYTARVIFHNGTQCLQRYYVTVQSNPWDYFLKRDLNIITSSGLLVIVGFVVWDWIKRRKLLVKDKKSKQDRTNELARKMERGIEMVAVTSAAQENKQVGQLQVTEEKQPGLCPLLTP